MKKVNKAVIKCTKSVGKSSVENKKEVPHDEAPKVPRGHTSDKSNTLALCPLKDNAEEKPRNYGASDEPTKEPPDVPNEREPVCPVLGDES